MATQAATGTLSEKTGVVGADHATGAPLGHFKRQEQPRPRTLPADAVERARADIDAIGSRWVPSVDIDIEEMLHGV